MDQESLESRLAGLNLPAIRYLPTIDSTNDEAWRWLDAGAPHGALVIANEQAAGRGRSGRHWVTTASGGLAFSLILRSPPLNPDILPRLAGLGAVATCQVLQNGYYYPAQVKWPNDILLGLRKAGGVLVESRWDGGDLLAVVIGIGINIATSSINLEFLPADELNLPATCVEAALGHPVDRMDFLFALLKEFFYWLPSLESPEFIHAWDSHLAYRGQWVELTTGLAAPSANLEENRFTSAIGKLIGITGDGSLQLLDNSGKLITAQAGEIHLRPLISPTIL